MDILLKEIIQRDLKYSFFFLKFIHLAALGLSYSMWDPFLFVCFFQHVGSLISAYGIQFPDQGSNPGPRALKAQKLSYWTTREDPRFHVLFTQFPLTVTFCTIIVQYPNNIPCI